MARRSIIFIRFIFSFYFLLQFVLIKIVAAQSGPYLGQLPPGSTPRLFAPQIFTGDPELHSPIIFSPDGKELYYSPMDSPPNKIIFSRLENEQWSQPTVATFVSEHGSGDPSFSPDGKRLYFLSWHPVIEGGQPNKENIWYVEREDSSWSEPHPVEETVNRFDVHWEVSVDQNYNLYFSGKIHANSDENIYRSAYVNGKYIEAELLSDSINTDQFESTPFIAPDGCYLIFSRIDLLQSGYADLFISFKNEDGTWSKAKNMGSQINAHGHELYPFVTGDGKYLFFLSTRDGMSRSYWVDARIIENYMTSADKQNPIILMPNNLRLYQNYPNPFNSSTIIKFYLAKTSRAVLRIYNSSSQQLRTLMNEVQEPGIRSVVWDGKDRFGCPVSSGIYFCHLQIGKSTQAMKMIVVR